MYIFYDQGLCDLFQTGLRRSEQLIMNLADKSKMYLKIISRTKRDFALYKCRLLDVVRRHLTNNSDMYRYYCFVEISSEELILSFFSVEFKF